MPNFFSLGKLQRAEMLQHGQAFIPHVFISWYLSANSVSSKDRYRVVFIGHSVAAACNILSVEAAINSVLVAVGKPPPGKQWHDVLRSALTRSLQAMKDHLMSDLHELESWVSRCIPLWLYDGNHGIDGRNRVSSGQLTQSPMPASGNPKDVAAQMEAKVEVAEVPEDDTEPATPNTRQRLFPADDTGRDRQGEREDDDDENEEGPLQDNGGERKDAKKKPKGKQAKGRTTRRSPSPMAEPGSGDDDSSRSSTSPRHKSRTPSPRKSPRKTFKPVCVPSDPIIVLLPVQLPWFLDSATTRGLH